MIGTALIGGLGNQMFQYAAGRALALRHDSGLVLDLSSFSRNRDEPFPRGYELNRLKIAAREAGRATRLELLMARRPQAIAQRISGWRILREASLSYDARFETAADGTYLFGYWQSWRYVIEHAATIAAELQPRMPLSHRNLALQTAMRATPSLSLHVRRSDYLSAQHAFHGVLDTEFYEQAVRRVREVEPNVAVYVFSDDLAWCREAFAGTDWNPTFVDWNRGDDNWQDLYAMSACRHAIVANSSFSWWAAWLGDQASQGSRRVVVAPSRWFAGGNVDPADRCPPSWQIV